MKQEACKPCGKRSGQIENQSAHQCGFGAEAIGKGSGIASREYRREKRNTDGEARPCIAKPETFGREHRDNRQRHGDAEIGYEEDCDQQGKAAPRGSACYLESHGHSPGYPRVERMQASDRGGSLHALLDVKRLRPVSLTGLLRRRKPRSGVQPTRIDISTSSA